MLLQTQKQPCLAFAPSFTYQPISSLIVESVKFNKKVKTKPKNGI